MPQLARPTALVRDSFVEAARDLRAEGWLPRFPVEKVAADFDGYVRRVLADKLGWGVPVTTLWYVDGTTYLGTVIVRHQLTRELTRRGGHIGYHVAPRHRRQGHATAMLAAALACCRDPLGLARVLITCAEPNTASRRVIEANGGMLENILDGECRYWVDLAETRPGRGRAAQTLRREAALAESGVAPAVRGYHHFAPTVSDVEASAQWYERVFRMTRVPVAFPHHGAEQGGYAVVLMEPRSGIVLGLHHHDGNPGQPFDERRTGLDHMSFAVTGRADLDTWANWLDSLGVENSGVVDTSDPVPYSVVVFRDPDNIQLELIYMAG